MKTKLFTIVLLCMACVGCTHNQMEIDDQGVFARTSTANLVSIDNEGNIKGATQGVGGTLINQDKAGNYAYIPGSVGIMTFQWGDDINGKIISPKDIKLTGIIITTDPNTGQITIKIASLEANLTAPMAQQVAALQIALSALEGMTKEEAKMTVLKWEEAGSMAPPLISALLQFVSML